MARKKPSETRGVLKSIPPVVPLLKNTSGRVVFPHAPIVLKFPAPSENNEYTEVIKHSPYLIVVPALPNGTSFNVGVLGHATVPDEKGLFLFTGITRVTHVEESSTPTVSARWAIFGEEVFPPQYRDTIHVRGLQMTKEIAGELLRDIEKRAGKKTLAFSAFKPAQEAVKNMNFRTVSVAIDLMMNLINRVDFTSGGASQDLFLPSLVILGTADVRLRLMQIYGLMQALLHETPLVSEGMTREKPDSVPREKQSYPERYEETKDHIPEEARKEIEWGLIRLKRDPDSPDSAKIRTKLDWILGMPWGVYTQDTEDLRLVRRMLDEDHAGLNKVKERILEFIAVRHLNPSAKSPILCFVGPPGVGKTSLGKSIARALGRKFINIALGGMHDESDIRGHREAYIGAVPGKIIDSIKKAGSANPVFMLDEIEKIGRDYRGDPASALLEVLDPEQNNHFTDHYLNVPFDLSRVLFITTANILEPMRPALRDRMEIIELPGYTPLEKVRIAQQHLIPRRRKENGFPIAQSEGQEAIDVAFSDAIILELIHRRTREAGVRNLERCIDGAFRKVAKAVRSHDLTVSGTIQIIGENVSHYCGKPIVDEHKVPGVLRPGVVSVLAVSETGGHVFEAEISIEHNSNGRKISMLGVRDSSQDKDTINKIEESLRIAFSALTARDGILFETLRALEHEYGPVYIQGNLTNGATPKDGPSAGVSLLLALYGALTRKSVKRRADTPLLGATGEIRQNMDEIGAIGGLRDKILAAHRYGIRRLIIPKANETDLEDVPQEILEQMEIKPVETRWEALLYAFPEDAEEINNYLLSQRSP